MSGQSRLWVMPRYRAASVDSDPVEREMFSISDWVLSQEADLSMEAARAGGLAVFKKRTKPK